MQGSLGAPSTMNLETAFAFCAFADSRRWRHYGHADRSIGARSRRWKWPPQHSYRSRSLMRSRGRCHDICWTRWSHPRLPR